ncbi:mercury(II) reductase [Aestuariispira insulae]|uniref:Mercuric reductase n=1 Tax=Aestuariispira insulae TaxID=1461337 RepID=A0A3D9H1G7_9PROT|nr:mercury(II) reductase [Aestuariispira insulae]RED43338.1 mercury(II) reductase [Aestuariispira insulae]
MSNNCCSKTDKGRVGRVDLAVIGAGSAGFSAAITAAEQGANVVLIGHGTIGGSCVNVGCVPSKTLIRATETLHQSQAASRFSGINGGTKLQDWSSLISQKDQLVADLRQAKYSDLLPAYDNISYLEGIARFEDGELTVNGDVLDASKIIIATGSKAVIPPIAGIETVECLTSTEALDLSELPKSLLVIGGGYIGCEIAQMLARAGVDVTIVCRSRLLPEGEPEISEALTAFLQDEGITVLDGLAYEEIFQDKGQVTLLARKDGQRLKVIGERLLVTAGRAANIESLNLPAAGIEIGENGGIRVDEHMRTSREGIYAAGDVTGRDQFVYMAAYGAKIAANNALNGDSRQYDATAMPAVVFSDPQVASVGLTEADARSRGLSVKTSVLPLEHLPRALAARDTRGLIKLVAETGSNKLIGAHILAPEGADSIQTAVMAIKGGLTVQDLADTIFPYLTTVEGFKLAAQTFDKELKILSCCAG